MSEEDIPTQIEPEVDIDKVIRQEARDECLELMKDCKAEKHLLIACEREVINTFEKRQKTSEDAETKWNDHVRRLKSGWTNKTQTLVTTIKASVFQMKRIETKYNTQIPHNCAWCKDIFCDICRIRRVADELEDAANALRVIYPDSEM